MRILSSRAPIPNLVVRVVDHQQPECAWPSPCADNQALLRVIRARTGFACILHCNKIRQGYARERILKPAVYFFVRRVFAAQGLAGSASWQR